MWKKDEVKIRFQLSLKEVQNLETEMVGQPIWISWKRGSKEHNKGDSQKVKVVKGGTATCNDTLSIDSTLFQDQKTKEFKGKSLELFLKEVRHPSFLSFGVFGEGMSCKSVREWRGECLVVVK